MLSKHLPFMFFFTYLVVCYFLFENGPWPWPVINYFPIRLYFISVLLFLFLGYVLAFRTHFRTNYSHYFESISFLKFIIIMAFLDVLVISIARSGSIIPDVIFGLSYPSEVYSQYVYKSFNKGWWTHLEYINVLMYFSFLVSSVCVFFYWSKLNAFYKVLGVSSVFYFVLVQVAIGVSKGVVAILLPLPITLFFLQVATGGISAKRFLKNSFVILMLFVIFMMFFTYIQLGREGGVATSGNFGPPISIVADRNAMLPEIISLAYESLTRYLTQGYFALSEGLAIDDYSFGFGVAASMVLMKKFEPIFGESWLSDTLLFKLERDLGWGVYDLWHSLPLWLINGFGVTGSLIVLFFFGYMYGRCWRYLRFRVTPLMAGMFLILNTAFLYFSANNQIFQNADSLIAFLAILFLLILAKYRVVLFRF